MKNVLLIGLGRFGRHMAQKLHDLNHQVLAIDKDERRIQDAMAYVTNAEIGDATDPALIDALGVQEFDLCVITMAHDLQASLEITSLLKKRGAPFVLVRVARDAHAQFLLACGADEIIYPEKQMADWAAVRYSGDHIFDYIRLSPEYAIYETEIPESWIGHTVVELAVRQRYRLNVLAIRRDGVVEPMPGPNHRFSRDERVILLGSDKDVQKYLKGLFPQKRETGRSDRNDDTDTGLRVLPSVRAGRQADGSAGSLFLSLLRRPAVAQKAYLKGTSVR